MEPSSGAEYQATIVRSGHWLLRTHTAVGDGKHVLKDGIYKADQVSVKENYLHGEVGEVAVASLGRGTGSGCKLSHSFMFSFQSKQLH